MERLRYRAGTQVKYEARHLVQKMAGEQGWGVHFYEMAVVIK